MTHLTEPAPDWTGQTTEERLRLCAELLYAHDLIQTRTFSLALSRIRARAGIQQAHLPEIAR